LHLGFSIDIRAFTPYYIEEASQTIFLGGFDRWERN